MERREVRSRSNAAIRRVAAALAKTSVTPNQISVFSAVAAAAVPLSLALLAPVAGALVALLAIQLRLLANVLDGLVAVEGGKSSVLGALYNEFPDRVADTLILVGVGYACGASTLGWLCALLAALTAYVRTFGGALGLPQSFRGPMAKQHRMAVVSASLVLFAVLQGNGSESLAEYAQGVLVLGLWVVALGSLWTCVTRTQGIAQQLKGQAPDA